MRGSPKSRGTSYAADKKSSVNAIDIQLTHDSVRRYDESMRNNKKAARPLKNSPSLLAARREFLLTSSRWSLATLGSSLLPVSAFAQIAPFGFWKQQSTLPTPTPTPPSTAALFAWGINTNGELGNETTTAKSSPTKIGALTTWSAVETGDRYILALQSDGTLWGWGYNAYGQLASSVTERSSPVQIGALTTWSKVSAGGAHALALQGGTLWSWGQGLLGALGSGNLLDRSSPVQVGALTTWASISAGANHSLAITTDGKLYAWGGNFSGQLGLGNTTTRSSPVQVGALTTWKQVSAATNNCTAAVTTDGKLFTWGTNADGQLGSGTRTARSSPVQVGTLTNWSKVAFGTGHMLAIKTDGTLWGWGYNTYGMVGDGSTISKSSPVQIGAMTDWAEITASGSYSLALKTNGTLWGWGDGFNGVLGNGSSSGSYSSPIQIGALTTWTYISAEGSLSAGITS
jgi:alpha-tubulin suppressor-like RCC1 family protein